MVISRVLLAAGAVALTGAAAAQTGPPHDTPWFVLGIVFMTVVVPLFMVMHYSTKWKATKGLSDDEHRMLEDLWKESQSMESRVNALETILDTEVTDWRKKL